MLNIKYIHYQVYLIFNLNLFLTFNIIRNISSSKEQSTLIPFVVDSSADEECAITAAALTSIPAERRRGDFRKSYLLWNVFVFEHVPTLDCGYCQKDP